MVANRSILITAAFFAILIGCISACSAPQQDVGGEVFCSSYENNYLHACRQNCEAETTAGDVDSITVCGEYCAGQLAKDDTFTDECRK